ncbi:MAG: hypothetical protein E6J55_21510 [Deltaproteobacteria bacterium]|nr:MAG: hypothetical protein E6J55_21510 [Deltaproteobacteria bacterium]
MPAGFRRGTSRFSDEQGRSLLSRTAVSEVTERLWEEYAAFATRDLSEHQLLYLFVDGVAERLRPGLAREAVLCAWGIDQEGKKVLLALKPGDQRGHGELPGVLPGHAPARPR